MTALYWLAGIAAFLGLCWLLGVIEERRAQWTLHPYLYPCLECRTGFDDPRAFAWHRSATHLETYDPDRLPHAAHRRIDDGRNSPGEILRGGPVAPASGDGAATLKQRHGDPLSRRRSS